MSESSAFAEMGGVRCGFPGMVDPFADHEGKVGILESPRLLLESDQYPYHPFWVLTDHPDRVRQRWPGTCDDADLGGDGVTLTARKRDNIALGVHIETQADADRLIPPLLGLADLCGLLWLDVRPREAIDFIAPVVHQKVYYCSLCRKWFDHSGQMDHCSDCGHEYDVTMQSSESCPRCGSDDYELTCPDCGVDGGNGGLDVSETWLSDILAVNCGIDWLHIHGDSEPLHPDWVRQPVHDAVDAGVPVWMESLSLDGNTWRQLPPWGQFQTGSEA